MHCIIYMHFDSYTYLRSWIRLITGNILLHIYHMSISRNEQIVKQISSTVN